MGAIASLSDLVNRMTGGNSGTPENLFFHKTASYNGGTADTWTGGVLYSAWRYDGFPGNGATPGAVEVPTKSTAGAIPFTNPGGGREKWITQAIAMPATLADIGGILIYDRLLHIGGLDANSTGLQKVQQDSGVSLTRNTGGIGNMIYVEIYAAIGTNARSLTITYTDHEGNTGQTTSVTIGGTASSAYNDVNAIFPVPLAAGDRGVRSVESVQLGTGTGTAGSFGITVARPLFWLLPHNRQGQQRDFTVGPGGMPEIDTDACLAYMFLTLATLEVAVYGCLSTVEA